MPKSPRPEALHSEAAGIRSPPAQFFGGPSQSAGAADGGFLRKLLAFAGPGYLVAVGYMDPGNWATDLAGGSQFGYTLL